MYVNKRIKEYRVVGECPYLNDIHTAHAAIIPCTPVGSNITYCIFDGDFTCKYSDECTYIREDNRNIEDCPLYKYVASNKMPL